jgi:hypothetical protein
MTCKVKWLLDEEFGKDGCNVWISTNGGKVFTQLFPDFPFYNSMQINGFWSKQINLNISGWTGDSDGWVDARFDLSFYRSDSVVIRFAFASDEKISTIENPDLLGFFIDDIRVQKDDLVIFEDDAESGGNMSASGLRISNADWFVLRPEKELIQPDHDLVLEFSINCGILNPGIYQNTLFILSNDPIYPFRTMDCHLNIERPEYDLAVEYARPSQYTIPIFSAEEYVPEIRVINQGLKSTNPVRLLQTIAWKKDYSSDTLILPALSPRESRSIFNDDYKSPYAGMHRFKLEFMDFPEDYNRFNNHFESSLFLTDTIDHFESGDQQWRIEGPWGITDIFQHGGQRSIHINPSTYRYLPEMNAILEYVKPLLFPYNGEVSINYYTYYKTQKDNDICYLEISPDRNEWQVIDSFSGQNLSWESRSGYVTSFKDSMFWLRFRFVSDESIEYYGLCIDDIKLVYSSPAATVSGNEITEPPCHLHPNYPNPFNTETKIRYTVEAGDSPQYVKLTIHNILGQKIATLVSGMQPPGTYNIRWDAETCGSGIYFCRLEMGRFTELRKMIYSK